MLNFLKGKRTYLTLIVGLVIVPLTTKLMGLDAGKLVEGLIAKSCQPDSACLDIAKQIGGGVQELYLAGVAALAAYFKSLSAVKPDAQL